MQVLEFVRVDNLTGRKYAGLVIVNESNARYFESALGRNLYTSARTLPTLPLDF